jgi:23S rRNA (guanosine2251-2'-O)-methyltransferase
MYVAEPLEAISLFKSKGYKIVCSGIRDSVSMYDADMKKPIFLIVGGEKRGISSSVEKQADVIARVEYGREFRGSLSTASAATVMVYEIYRQNREK